MAWGDILLFLTGVAFTMKIGDEFSRGPRLIFAIAGYLPLISARSLAIFLADGLVVQIFRPRSYVDRGTVDGL